ncbi:hypothetical protein [Chitinophaga sp. Cy-1792]|uniref:hypothetical protein n=1 Tax=Chitinophaga sp. Cy-1792 TaxID=2608339 RepID=UPI00141DB210|nr:hypothetical protein [Chitinophaga sp. Cy-1792]NIG53410.1 hypothetical protein [Chitinophaga sp. Cy-1792]
MKKPFRLFVILIISGCSVPTLRPSVKGTVCDNITGKPLEKVIISSYDAADTLAGTNTDGSFVIPAVKDTRALFPGEERGKLAPNSDKLLFKKEGYITDTIFIFDKNSTKDDKVISLETIKLQPITQ